MPTIRIEFDDAKVSDEEILQLSEATQKIVSEITKIDDVFVYANSAKIKVKIAPIELYVQMSASKIPDLDALFAQIKEGISGWKAEVNFKQPINLTVMPMVWKFDIDI